MRSRPADRRRDETAAVPRRCPCGEHIAGARRWPEIAKPRAILRGASQRLLLFSGSAGPAGSAGHLAAAARAFAGRHLAVGRPAAAAQASGLDSDSFSSSPIL